MENKEDSVSDYAIKSFSHLINVHHVWIHRLLNLPSESHSWDILPLEYWGKLAHENHSKTIDYLEKQELNEKINYTSEEGIQLEKETLDILYHILNHSNYHRAQIAVDLRKSGIRPPDFNFISFK